jgi:enterochelin esterase-like enzyme
VLTPVAEAPSPAPAAPLAGSLVARRFYSHSLRRVERVLVYTPPNLVPGTSYPLAIFLHGVPGSPESMAGLGIPQRMEALVAAGRSTPFIAAFPQGGDTEDEDTEWADSALEPADRWETYVRRDLVLYLQKRYPLIHRSGARAVAGLSMGGYGAMNIALHNRDEFGVVESWSGYFTSNTPRVFRPGSHAWDVYSPQLYAPALTPSLRAEHPRISFYVGGADPFAEENAVFSRLLDRLGVPHAFTLYRGQGHRRTLWVKELDPQLEFLSQSFRADGAG